MLHISPHGAPFIELGPEMFKVVHITRVTRVVSHAHIPKTRQGWPCEIYILAMRFEDKHVRLVPASEIAM